MNVCDLIQLALELARKNDLTAEEKESLDMLEDYAVNELGDD